MQIRRRKRCFSNRLTSVIADRPLRSSRYSQTSAIESERSATSRWQRAMKALVHDKSGSAGGLVVRELETPVPTENEVQVRVQATSLNDFDLFIMQPPLLIRLVRRLLRAVSSHPRPRVRIAGCGVAGIVTAVGS